jgi:membrane protein implicated in regulation of membrane protease activity
MFGIGVLASLVIWRHFFKKQQKESDTPNLNRRSQQLVGRHFTLDTPIIDGRGKIRVDDTWWRVAGDDMPLGAKVRVIDVDGVVLKVEKI